MVKDSFYIYLFVDISTSLPFYVGKGKNNRWKQHFYESVKPHSNLRKLRTIAKLQEQHLPVLVIKIFTGLSEAVAYQLEEMLIKLWGRKDIDENGILTNLTLGKWGGYTVGRYHPNFGKPLSVSTKLKISQSLTGSKNPRWGKRPPADELQKRVSTRKTNSVWHSNDAKQKIKAATSTEEYKEQRFKINVLKRIAFYNEVFRQLDSKVKCQDIASLLGVGKGAITYAKQNRVKIEQIIKSQREA